MTRKEIGLAVAAVASLAVVMVGGNALARGGGSSGELTAATSSAAPAPSDPAHHWPGHHTPVTGSELSRVKAAVQAEDSAVTVRMVRQDADGSYDVFGTKKGAPVVLEVSKDLKTVTEHTGGLRGPGGPGGFGRHHGFASQVSGGELSKVKAAVKGKDAAVTVRGVVQDPSGAYHVFGTKKGAPVVLEVSKDLKTVTEHTGGLRGPGGPGGFGQRHGFGSQVTGAELSKVKAAVKGQDAAVTVRGVVQDPSGAYHVFGTKKGAPVVLEVSKDLRTVTEHSGPGPRADGPGVRPEATPSTAAFNA